MGKRRQARNIGFNHLRPIGPMTVLRFRDAQSEAGIIDENVNVTPGRGQGIFKICDGRDIAHVACGGQKRRTQFCRQRIKTCLTTRDTMTRIPSRTRRRAISRPKPALAPVPKPSSFFAAPWSLLIPICARASDASNRFRMSLHDPGCLP